MSRKVAVILQSMALACALLSQPAPAQFLTAEACSALGAQKATVGMRCATSSGAEFRRYLNPQTGALGWQDLGEGGKVWYDIVKINSAQPEAAKFCAVQAGTAPPTLQDLDRAGARGLKDVVKNSVYGVKNPLLWSGQMDETSRGERAVGYALDTGDFHAAKISEPFDNAVIICVGPAATLR